MANYRVPVLESFSFQPPVTDYQSAPPGSPAKGNRYLVLTPGSGAWSGHDEQIAYYDGSQWQFDTAFVGWLVYCTADVKYYKFSGSAWEELTTPIAGHHASHESGGGDAIKLDDLAAPDDNTDLNATDLKHGLLPKLGGGTTNFLRADGTWSAPVGNMAKSTYDTDDDGRVDYAESLSDGSNVVSAAEAKQAYDRRATYDTDYKCLVFTI